jgi:transporter family-2 protein
VDRSVALVLTVVAGSMLALQTPINSALGKGVGSFQAAFISFATGTIILAAVVALAHGGFGQLAGVRSLAPQYLIGGVLGACIATTVLVAVRALGAAGVVAASIAGQLTMSVLIDQFGLLGVEKDPASAMKLLGVLLLAGGTLLVVRG